VLVVTESDYGGLTGQAPNHTAEKIRQWLINHYIAYGIEYVLLIGDPHPYESGEGDVPMKRCVISYGSTYYPPTDGFYADLTGNWDLDGDGNYGEWEDYSAGGGVDFAMEVFVGRIPVYESNYTALDGILQKTMDYENEDSTTWRRSILLPMGFQASGYDGAPLAEQMSDDYLTGRSYTRWRQYQQGSGACGVDSIYASEQELRGGTVVRDRWAANDYGIVCWWGHGSSTSTSVGYDGCWDGTLLNSTYAASLDDDHPAFTYQNSCTNGYPENSSNLQYAILKNGGIATVSASRVSWFNTGVGYGDFDGSSTNSGIGYEYVERLTRSWRAARALFEAKLAVVSNIGAASRLMNQYDFNLYGDPAVRLDASSSGCSFTEYFSDGLADNWIDDGSGNWSVIPYVYRMTGTGGDIVRYSYYDCNCSDFTYSAYVRKTSGGTSTSIGLFFRSDGEYGDNEYIFHINLNGSFRVYKLVDGTSTVLSSGWEYSAAINTGLNVWNHLKVEARGATFKVYCNDTLLGTYTDASHAYGKVGLKVYDVTGDSDVAQFDSISLTCSSGCGAMPAVNHLLLGD
jgi:hypothetical protein